MGSEMCIRDRASATNSMTHIAIQEGLNGSVAKWLEKVSDEQYALKSD